MCSHLHCWFSFLKLEETDYNVPRCKQFSSTRDVQCCTAFFFFFLKMLPTATVLFLGSGNLNLETDLLSNYRPFFLNHIPLMQVIRTYHLQTCHGALCMPQNAEQVCMYRLTAAMGQQIYWLLKYKCSEYCLQC